MVNCVLHEGLTVRGPLPQRKGEIREEMSTTIRKFDPVDLDSCTSVFMSAYNNEIWQCNWSFARAKEYIKEITDHKKFIGFTLLVDNAIKGAILCRERTCWNNNEIYVEELFVSPDVQRRGFGTALLRAVERYIKERGLAGFTLVTNRYTPAPDFYRKNGFCDGEHVLFMYKIV